MTERIFWGRYCVVHYKKSGKKVSWNIEKSHLIHKSQSTRYKFDIWNILPTCEEYHRTGTEMAAHPYGSNTEVRDKFLAWVRDNLPLHWAWYLKHKDESPHTLYTADWAEICDELRYYANHPLEAEYLIYEKDSL